MFETISEIDLRSWEGQQNPDLPFEALIEDGRVLFFPHLAFDILEGEKKFLSPDWSDGKSKNISIRGPIAKIQGAQGSCEDLILLTNLVTRFRTLASCLVDQLFPAYRGKLQEGFTSYRPARVETRVTSWRKDDTRLHIDSFPSNPTGGLRLLRVFSNIHPGDLPRTWRVGEPFKDYAKKFLPNTRPLFPGQATALSLLGLTKSRRTEYDHLMGQLHDLGKQDLDYQSRSPQIRFDFPPGSTWVVFSDQVLHAVMAGQFMLEQTFYLKPQDLLDPSKGPLSVLENLTGRRELA